LIGIKAGIAVPHQMNWMEGFVMRPVRVVVLAGLMMASPGIAAAQSIGDPQAGRRLAEAWCSECHAITLSKVGAPRQGPDFVEVAKRAKTTALSLNVFLRSSHDNMPNFILQRGEADDIVAYILSLKGQ
jgi:mono/diheme cytochrome c family protein